MQNASVLTWMRDRRAIAFIVVLALALTIAVGLVISGPADVAAVGDDPVTVQVEVEADLTLAGPSWTWFRLPPPGDDLPWPYVDMMGTSWS